MSLIHRSTLMWSSSASTQTMIFITCWLTCKRYADPSTNELSTLRGPPRNEVVKTQLVSCLDFVAHCATIPVGCPESRPSRSVKTLARQLAELPRRLFRHAPQQAGADHAEERRQPDACLGLPDAA